MFDAQLDKTTRINTEPIRTKGKVIDSSPKHRCTQLVVDINDSNNANNSYTTTTSFFNDNDDKNIDKDNDDDNLMESDEKIEKKSWGAYWHSVSNWRITVGGILTRTCIRSSGITL